MLMLPPQPTAKLIKAGALFSTEVDPAAAGNSFNAFPVAQSCADHAFNGNFLFFYILCP